MWFLLSPGSIPAEAAVRYDTWMKDRMKDRMKDQMCELGWIALVAQNPSKSIQISYFVSIFPKIEILLGHGK